MSVDFKVSVVLPAGGSGLRVGTPTPKQYWQILDRPLMYYTCTVFEEIPWISEVVVPVSEDHIESLTASASQLWGFKKTKFVLGSTTRHRSISAGVSYLRALPSDQQPDVVIVHDIVRPFVEEPLLRSVSQAAFDHGASGAVLPLVSTVVAVNKEGFLDHALDRTKYLASHTPQACRLSMLAEAYGKCTEYDFEFGTEVLHLMQTYAAAKVKMVDGDPNIWKVTYKPDLYAAQQMVKERLRHVAIVTGGSRGIGKAVVRGLRDRGMKVIAVARTEADLVAASKETGCDVFIADVSQPAEVKRLFQYVTEKYGHVDVIINNAGNAVLAPIAQMVRSCCWFACPHTPRTMHSGVKSSRPI
jgi:2-C-methyl-D-erythritol 4-phosphate cytidylyltransferase